MNPERKKRSLKLLKEVFITVLIGAAYSVFVNFTGLAIPCPIKLLTGKYCPGCGVTRMAVALIHLDLATAFKSNMLIMILLPALILWGLYKSLEYIKEGETSQTKAETAAILIVSVAAIAFGILRNTESFAFLAP